MSNVDNSGGGSGSVASVAIVVLVIVAVLAIGYFFFGRGGGHIASANPAHAISGVVSTPAGAVTGHAVAQ